MKELEKIVIEPKTSIISHLSQQMEVSHATVQSGQKGIIWLARLVVVRAPPAVELGSMRYLRR
jgi:hypothetical protein